MSFQPSLSIIIPAYNYASLLTNAVESAAKQHIPNLEILIVNDGSTDETKKIADQLAASLDHVRVIHKENGGSSSARNTGIRNTTGDYLIFLDADDTLESGALAKILDAIKDYNHPLFIVCDHYNIDTSGKKRYRSAIDKDITRLSNHDLLKLYFKKKLSIPNGAVIMHRSIFREISYNQSLVSSEDIPVMAFALARTKTVHVPIALNCVFTHEGSYRTEAWRVKQAKYTPVDEFFSYPNIENECKHLKNYMYARRALSIFRVLYRANEQKLARTYFLAAIRFSPELLLELGYLKKFIASFFMRKQIKE